MCWIWTENSEGRSENTNVRAVSILSITRGVDVSLERESEFKLKKRR